MDIKMVFLNGMLAEDVYMIQPKGLVNPANANKVRKLQHFISRPKTSITELESLL
jgi:hypothetical protein